MPRHVTIIASLFLLLGAVAAVDLLTGLLHRRLVVDMNLLLVPAGIGLLARRAFWRRYSIAVLGLFGLCATGVFAVSATLAPNLVTEVFGFGLHPGKGSTLLLLGAGLIAVLATMAWGIRLLNRTEVVVAFREAPPAARSEATRE